MEPTPKPLIQGSFALEDDEEGSSPQQKQKDIDEEKKNFYGVLKGYSEYEIFHFQELNNQLKNWSKLKEKHKSLLPNYSQKFSWMKNGIVANYNLILRIIKPYIEKVVKPIKESTVRNAMIKDEYFDNFFGSNMEKVNSVLKQFYREWSKEGARERESYSLIINFVKMYFKKMKIENFEKIKVLIPGCGLGRLPFEFAKEGFHTQGNEFSMHMLLGSNYILNYGTKQTIIYPFIHQRSNVLERSDYKKGIKIPDVNTSSLKNENFSMVAGDFLDVYSRPKEKANWNCIATYFFIDTAKNIFEYIEVINHVLQKGGLWVNYGPLLYHFENDPSEFSVEITLSDLKLVIKKMGFEIIEEKITSSKYCANPRSMFQTEYNCSFFVAKKISNY